MRWFGAEDDTFINADHVVGLSIRKEKTHHVVEATGLVPGQSAILYRGNIGGARGHLYYLLESDKTVIPFLDDREEVNEDHRSPDHTDGI